jgi:hypothetical protein
MNSYLQLSSSTTLEKIKAYYRQDEVILSPKEEDIRKRWSAAFTMMLNDISTDREVADYLMATFPISQAQAYRDISNARLLFGDVHKANKEATRYMVYQWAIEMFKMAKQESDFKGMDRALLRITRVYNLDVEDIDIPDPSKIQPPIQMLSLTFNFIKSAYFKLADEKAQKEILALVNKMQAMIDKSPVKEYLDLYQTEDIPHKDITNGD